MGFSNFERWEHLDYLIFYCPQCLPPRYFAYRIKTWVQALFLCKAEQGIFHCLESWQVGWYLLLLRSSQYNLAGTFHCRPSLTRPFSLVLLRSQSIIKLFLYRIPCLSSQLSAHLRAHSVWAPSYLCISRHTWLVPKFQPFRTDSDSLRRLTKPSLLRLSLSLTWSQPRLNSQSLDGLRSGVGNGSAPSWTKISP